MRRTLIGVVLAVLTAGGLATAPASAAETSPYQATPQQQQAIARALSKGHITAAQANAYTDDARLLAQTMTVTSSERYGVVAFNSFSQFLGNIAPGTYKPTADFVPASGIINVGQSCNANGAQWQIQIRRTSDKALIGTTPWTKCHSPGVLWGPYYVRIGTAYYFRSYCRYATCANVNLSARTS
jgi:hypothetical protein